MAVSVRVQVLALVSVLAPVLALVSVLALVLEVWEGLLHLGCLHRSARDREDDH